MTEDAVRDEIAFIRRAIEEGRGYASGRSPDMVVWGVAVALGYLGTYARVRGWWGFATGRLWAVCIGLPWLFSLRGLLRGLLGGLLGGAPRSPGKPMGRAMAMLWLGSGVSLTMLGLSLSLSGDVNQEWLPAVAAGAMGVGFFASAALCNLGWMRAVAIGWWVGEVLLYTYRHQPEILLLSAALMLGLLAVPGIILLRRPARP
jgi:hypothetical protein